MSSAFEPTLPSRLIFALLATLVDDNTRSKNLIVDIELKVSAFCVLVKEIEEDNARLLNLTHELTERVRQLELTQVHEIENEDNPSRDNDQTQETTKRTPPPALAEDKPREASKNPKRSRNH